MKRMKNFKNSMPAFLLALGIAGIGIGLVNGESAVVLQKAIQICLECIGIG